MPLTNIIKRKEYMKKYHKKYYLKNRINILRKNNQYQKKNIKKYQKLNKKYYIQNKSRINLISKEYYKNHKTKVVNNSLRSRLKRKYKLSLKDYKLLLKNQNGLCAICNKKETRKNKNGKYFKLAIDHNHKTGKRRGFLCNLCNQGLGRFKDNIILLKEAIKYLNKY